MDERKTVLIGPDRSGQLLLVLPLAGVREDLTTLATLLYGKTFGEVRANDFAWRLINTSLDSWAGRLREEEPELAELSNEEVIAVRARDTDPFPDTQEFFGWDWDGWRPEARLLTANWLQEAAPEILRWLAEEDSGWGFDYTSACWLPTASEPRLVELLRQRGYATVQAPWLAGAYDDPPRDVSSWLKEVLAPAADEAVRPT